MSKTNKEKNQLFKKWIKHPSTENRDKYKTQRNVCDKTIRNANTCCKLTADDFNDLFSIIGEKLANKFGENLIQLEKI